MAEKNSEVLYWWCEVPCKFLDLWVFSLAHNPKAKFFLWSPILKPPGTFLSPKKIRGPISVSLTTKFYPKRLTLSASNPQPKPHIIYDVCWTSNGPRSPQRFFLKHALIEAVLVMSFCSRAIESGFKIIESWVRISLRIYSRLMYIPFSFFCKFEKIRTNQQNKFVMPKKQ